MTNGSTTATHFWPTSFAERGVAVPFTTPSVAMARVRNDERGRLELVISGLSGGRGVYVIGWSAVPETFKLTVFDRVLHEYIKAIDTVTPDTVREAVLHATATGLAGEDAAEAAVQSSSKITEDQIRISLALTQHLVESFLETKLDIGLAELATSAGQQKVQNLLGRIARKENIAPETLSRVLTEWGDLLEALGVLGHRPRGRYRRILDEASHFLTSFSDWTRTGEIGDDHPATLIPDVLNETLHNWKSAFQEADGYAQDPRSTLKNWGQAKSVLESLSVRIPWLEDGWPVIFAMWENALHGDHDQRLETVATILSGLPLMPRDEVAPNRRQNWMEFAKRLSLLAARNEQRSQNDIGLENMLRQEQVLARSLG
tara:strand:- start:2354 stop:3472 length:1119 start_codon:yes stop_codon:yes gene_type:complete